MKRFFSAHVSDGEGGSGSGIRVPGSNLEILIFMLGLGLLIRKAYISDSLSSPLPIITTALAAAVMFRPGSPRMALAFAIAMLAEAAWYAPFYFSAHMIFVMFAVVSFVLANVAYMLKEKALPVSLDRLEDGLFPLLRAGLYAMFAIVVLHKLNHGFFDPAISCAVDQFGDLRARLPFIPDLSGALGGIATPLLTVLVEAAIPILLFFASTRQLGLIVAIGFHFAMGINGFHTFSIFSMVMYMAFLPREFHRDAGEFLASISRTAAGRVFRRAVPIGFAAFAVGMTLSHAAERTYQIGRISYWAYLVIAPAVAAIYLWIAFGQRPGYRRAWPSGWLTAPWQVVLVFGFVLHGITPYLGLKTEAVLSMFSNLQTEEGHWNHLFLPEGMRIATFQDSPVTVTSIGPMTQLRDWERDFLPPRVEDADTFAVTRFELKRQLSAHCRAGQGPIPVSYVVDGRTFSVADACADPDLSRDNGWLLEKIFWFRPVFDSADRCLH